MSSAEGSRDKSITEQPWDGLHGLRSTGIGVVTPYTLEETNKWFEDLGLPPRMDDETDVQWHLRTNGGKVAGSTALSTTVEVKADEPIEGEDNGNQTS